MALTDEFEHVRVSLLHRSPLHTLEQAVSELLSEETRLATRKIPHSDVVFATHRGSSSSFHNTRSGFTKKCKYCKKTDHLVLDCPSRTCQICHVQGPGHSLRDCPQNKSSQNIASRGGPPKSAVAAADNSSSAASASESTVAHLEDLLRQILNQPGNPHSTAMSVTSGISSWFFDSACCNHMTFDLTIFFLPIILPFISRMSTLKMVLTCQSII